MYQRATLKQTTKLVFSCILWWPECGAIDIGRE